MFRVIQRKEARGEGWLGEGLSLEVKRRECSLLFWDILHGMEVFVGVREGS